MASEFVQSIWSAELMGSSAWTLLFPLIVPPTTNGWSFPRRSIPNDHVDAPGLHAPELAAGLISPNQVDAQIIPRSGGDRAENGRVGKYVMGDDGSLTDDEEGGGGWMD